MSAKPISSLQKTALLATFFPSPRAKRCDSKEQQRHTGFVRHPTLTSAFWNARFFRASKWHPDKRPEGQVPEPTGSVFLNCNVSCGPEETVYFSGESSIPRQTSRCGSSQAPRTQALIWGRVKTNLSRVSAPQGQAFYLDTASIFPKHFLMSSHRLLLTGSALYLFIYF